MVDIKRPPQKKTKKYILYGLGVVALVALTIWVSTLEAAPPSVDQATIWTGEVERGELLREVRGPGTLVPEDVLFVSARTAGRIERILIEPGAHVTPETVIMVLQNPNLELEVQSAQFQWRGAEAGYTELRVRLQQARLAQEATVAQVEAAYNEARMTAERDTELYEENLISELNKLLSESRARQTKRRFEIEQAVLENLEESHQAQLEASRVQVDQRRAEYELREADLGALEVRPTISGVLQEVPVDEGQQVTPGTNLARVADPRELKAELRIAQTQAGEVAIGQSATVDTRNGVVPGRVVRIDPSVSQGTVTVDVELLTDELPPNARPDLSVDGRVEIERLTDVLFVDRPAFGQADQTVSVFKLVKNGTEAVRTNVRFGKSSVDKIVVEEGLEVGDEIILSDMSRFDNADRVRIN